MFNGDTLQNRYLRMFHGAIESGWREANRFLQDVRPFNRQERKKCSVVIIGAGLAGLGAARELIAAGISDIIILEAQGRAGGRVCTLPLQNTHIELGAQWIHGEDNPIYNIAHKQNLLANTTSAEALGPYFKTDGTELCSSLVAHVSHKVSGILEDCEEFVNSTENYPPSVGQQLCDRFEEYLDNCLDDTIDEKSIKWDLLQWHFKFQEIDNSCSNLYNLSAKDWGKYKFTGGEDCINLLNGYSSVVDALIDDLPDKMIHYNSPVKCIDWKLSIPSSTLEEDSTSAAVSVTCESGSVIEASHVIVTCSIGYLKAHYRALFKPSLPSSLTSVIDAMGFGVVDKVFLVYEKPWWSKERQAFQIVRSQSDAINKEVNNWWLKDLTGFDVLSLSPPILLAWVGGEGAVHMEQLDEEDVAEHCTELLRGCLNNALIPMPMQIKRSAWYSNPYILGGYSHTTSECDKLECGPKDLSVPVFSDLGGPQKHPTILIAGEAAHESHFSTTHGAFESGQSQARVLVNYQNEKNSKVKEYFEQ